MAATPPAGAPAEPLTVIEPPSTPLFRRRYGITVVVFRQLARRALARIRELLVTEARPLWLILEFRWAERSCERAK